MFIHMAPNQKNLYIQKKVFINYKIVILLNFKYFNDITKIIF